MGEQPCEGGRVTPPPGAGLGGMLLLRGIVAILGLWKTLRWIESLISDVLSAKSDGGSDP